MGISRHFIVSTLISNLVITAALLVGGCDLSADQTDRYEVAELWNNGDWDNQDWDNQLWNNGDWNNNDWDNGDWNNGYWNNGDWGNQDWDNGDWQNGPVWIWIAWNGQDFDGIAEGPLTADALQDTIVTQVLEDEYARRFMDKTVSCALDGDQSLTLTVAGEELTFLGAIGLAPAWGEEDGDCDADCQGWVTSCLLSRNNAHGETIRISMRGDHESLALGETEAEDFPHAEATYFGNLFHPYPEMYACVADGETEIPRACGDSADDCLVSVVGACSEVCEDDECEVEDVVYDEPISVFNSDETYEHYYGA
jgi:hypothetical protein